MEGFRPILWFIINILGESATIRTSFLDKQMNLKTVAQVRLETRATVVYSSPPDA